MGRFAAGWGRRGAWLGVAVFVAAMALVAAAFRIAHNERAFEMDRWAVRLKSASTQPLDVVNDWLSASRSALRGVAVNPTVQIYLSQKAMGGAATPESEAQAAFLQSYIASLGSRGPFAALPGGRTGLAVLDAQRHPVAATFGYRPPAQAIGALMSRMHNGEAGPVAMPAKDGSQVSFLSAVHPIQGLPSAAAVGYVVAERRLDKAFWFGTGSVLAADHGHESLIASAPGGRYVVVGSSIAETSPLAGSGEALAARNPGMLQQADGLSGENALHLGVPVPGTDWTLVESVPTSHALAGVEARIRNLLTILLLSLLAIILGILLLWRHVVAVQQAAAREAGLKLYRSVAEVLLQAIDQRDPGAAEHSRRVAALSRQVTLRMGLPGADADTAELVGALMNVGKLFVPVPLLTKSGALEDAEASQFAEGATRWLAILADTPLNLPLAPVLEEAYRLGRGESGSGSAFANIAHTAVAANKAVALMSPRAYRMAHSPQETLEILGKSQPPVPAPILAAMTDLLTADK